MAATRSTKSKRNTNSSGRFPKSTASFSQSVRGVIKSRGVRRTKSGLTRKSPSKHKETNTAVDNDNNDNTESNEAQSSTNENERHSPENEQNSESSSIGFNLDNFESRLSDHSLNELRETLRGKKQGTSNRIPQDVQEALALLQQNYIKSKLMLALIGNVSEKTVNKYL